MKPLTFRSAAIIKGERTKVVLALVKGQLQEQKAQELGLLLHESESGEDVMYYNHPTNVMAIRTMKATYAGQGYDLTFEMETIDGRSVSEQMLPREVPFYSSGYAKCFDPDHDTIQAPRAVDKMVIGLIAKYHPRLASAAVLTLIEDYDPEEMKAKLIKNPNKGEVWAYVNRASAVTKRLTGFDFEIHLCKEIWNKVDMATKRYMLDHECGHMGRSSATGAWELWQHDIQGFYSDLTRYGGKIKEIDNLVSSITYAHKASRKERRKDDDAYGSEE